LILKKAGNEDLFLELLYYYVVIITKSHNLL